MLVLLCREEKSEQLLDTRQELENMEVELKRIQQEVKLPVTALCRVVYKYSNDLTSPPPGFLSLSARFLN